MVSSSPNAKNQYTKKPQSLSYLSIHIKGNSVHNSQQYFSNIPFFLPNSLMLRLTLFLLFTTDIFRHPAISPNNKHTGPTHLPFLVMWIDLAVSFSFSSQLSPFSSLISMIVHHIMPKTHEDKSTFASMGRQHAVFLMQSVVDLMPFCQLQKPQWLRTASWKKPFTDSKSDMNQKINIWKFTGSLYLSNCPV